MTTSVLVQQIAPRDDQIETNGFAGTVGDVDMRVTGVRDLDGQLVLVPNADVFTHPIGNRTRLGPRRTPLIIGIDHRDDQDRSIEVLRRALTVTPGVLENPAPEALTVELGGSPVDIEVAYWTEPDMRSVRPARDAVLRGCKRAVEAEGMTIPWPIRTLAADKHPLQVRRLEVVDAGGSGRARER
jgi:small conductance mechanosensitive channel